MSIWYYKRFWLNLGVLTPCQLAIWRASLIAQLVKNLPCFNSWVRRIPWRSDRLPIPVFLGFPCGSANKESAYNVGDLGLIPGLGRSPGEGKGYPLQYSGLENSMDCLVHGVAKSRTRLSGFHCKVRYAKSLQSCPTLCDPIDGSPPGSPVPGILQARTLEWIAISFSKS